MREWEIAKTQDVIDEAKIEREERAFRKMTQEEKALRAAALEEEYKRQPQNRQGRRAAERKMRKRFG